MIDLNGLIEEFINPPVKEKLLSRLKKSREEREKELQTKFLRGQAVKDFIKTYAWREVVRPKYMDSLKRGFGNLMRDGLRMSEVELKTTISEMRESLGMIADLRNIIDLGNDAGERLNKIDEAENSKR